MAPKKSKRTVSSDDTSDSGPDDRNPPPKKSKQTEKKETKKSTSNEEEHSWVLERNRFVKVRDFKGKLYVDIREFYEKDGNLLPGKKGISLTMQQWNKLLDHVEDIKDSINKLG
ncbi:RNA polymerase II transcriptional coactivator [Daktulosphaira vitifoliae]|uniref:RNA polymerase II transcriptional coactivator n=1 Tax=Daktulosphaira vitifoliae TaxID=58002 RepID=UPI0021AACDBC|nr:RNA polymerase II transcriptional coactivator [Daktulosphaira vitifoliae]